MIGQRSNELEPTDTNREKKAAKPGEAVGGVQGRMAEKQKASHERYLLALELHGYPATGCMAHSHNSGKLSRV